MLSVWRLACRAVEWLAAVACTIDWGGVLRRGLCWSAVHCSCLALPFCGMVWRSVAWPGCSVAGLDVLG